MSLLGRMRIKKAPEPPEPEPASKCKHLNLRIVGSNSPGLPFDCLDCGATGLKWTALNGLLEELNKLISNPK